MPARLDRLPWSRFHWRVVVALGITWVLDGLEVTLVGSLARRIHQSPSLALTETQIGLTASAYLVGAVVGALGFGWLADRIGRRRLFFITLIVYMLASIATGFAWDFWSFALFRALTGAGIGGEYAAVNSAIQELIPARQRGTTDLASTAPSGAARRSARWPRWWCWTRRSSTPRSAGAPPSWSAARCAVVVLCCAATCRRARAG